jgi:hypothetical protein
LKSPQRAPHSSPPPSLLSSLDFSHPLIPPLLSLPRSLSTHISQNTTPHPIHPCAANVLGAWWKLVSILTF